MSEKSDKSNLLKTSGEPGRTRTCNPLIDSRDAKYSMFQAVSSFRECQKWSDLGVVVIKDVMKSWEVNFLSAWMSVISVGRMLDKANPKSGE